MQRLAIMAMQTCQEYAQKSSAGALTEYEAQMYEWLCRFVTSHSRGCDFVLRRQMGELEREALRAEAEHQEWMDAHREDGEPPARPAA